MIKAALNGVISLLLYLVNILLTPINSIINQYLPNINTYLDYISAFFYIVSDFIGWVLDALLIDAVTIDLLISFLVAKILAPFAASAVKTIVRWWEALV